MAQPHSTIEEMKKIVTTSVLIDAPLDYVWAILTDFDSYHRWNPYLTRISGKAGANEQLRTTVQEDDEQRSFFSPIIHLFKPKQEFRWREHFMFPGLFDGEHIFKVDRIGENETRFIQEEIFTGIMVPFLAHDIQTKTRNGFDKMNRLLKARAERLVRQNVYHAVAV